MENFKKFQKRGITPLFIGVSIGSLIVAVLNSWSEFNTYWLISVAGVWLITKAIVVVNSQKVKKVKIDANDRYKTKENDRYKLKENDRYTK